MMKTLTIRWQRLVDDGKTCPRCSDTGEEVRKAADLLGRALEPLDIGVVLEEGEIGPQEFKQQPLESNRITIGGRAIEEWLAGATGQSPCCDVCGPNECRTLTVGGRSFEKIPAELIIKAGMLAAAGLTAPTPAQPCCKPIEAAPRGRGRCS